MTLEAHQLKHFKGKCDRKSVEQRYRKMDMSKISCKAETEGSSMCLPQGNSGVNDKEEEMPKASEGKPYGGVAQT